MKKILFLLLIALYYSCKNEPPNIENETPQEDNGWFLYQQKIHSLIPIESYNIACRITLIPADNHLPASVITTWESGENNFIKITNIKGFRGRFESAGTYALRREFNPREIMNCFYSNEKNLWYAPLLASNG